MSPLSENFTFDPSTSKKLVTVGLVVLLAASLAFMGWAIYDSRQKPVAGATETVVEEEALLPEPPPPPPKYYCPLSGMEFDTKAPTVKRPIVVQVDNAPAARPQSGLSQADIVYEAMAEGQVTRFSAVFACRDADTVGPVRSARLINLELVPEYNALLANSGASSGVSAELAARPDIPNINHPGFPGIYWRTQDRFAPHNLMTSTTSIRQAASEAGILVEVDRAGAGPVFRSSPNSAGAPVVGTPARTIAIPYSSSVDVGYQYDPGSSSWLRSMGGEPHIDALTKAQIATKNVIIQYVQVIESDIEEDTGGNLGLIFKLTGTGKVVIFRDGQAITGTWQRAGIGEATSYVDAAGKPIPLSPGQTWIQLVPPDFPATWG